MKLTHIMSNFFLNYIENEAFFRDKIPLRKTIPASFLKEIWSRQYHIL